MPHSLYPIAAEQWFRRVFGRSGAVSLPVWSIELSIDWNLFSIGFFTITIHRVKTESVREFAWNVACTWKRYFNGFSFICHQWMTAKYFISDTSMCQRCKRIESDISVVSTSRLLWHSFRHFSRNAYPIRHSIAHPMFIYSRIESHRRHINSFSL